MNNTHRIGFAFFIFGMFAFATVGSNDKALAIVGFVLAIVGIALFVLVPDRNDHA